MGFLDLNVLDVFIILTVSGLMMTGFFSGVSRVIAGLFAVYFSTIVAAAFYDALGSFFIDSVSDMGEKTGYLLAFLLLFAVMTAGFFWAIGYSIKAVEVRRGRLSIMDNIGGATLALTVAVLAIAMTLSVSVIILGAFSQSASGDDSLGVLGRQIRDSELVPIFLKLQEPMVTAFTPWFPDGLPPILEPPPTV